MHVMYLYNSPVRVHGIPFFNHTMQFERLPEYLREKYPHLKKLGRRCAGARLRFMTNSKNLYFRFSVEKVEFDIGIPIWGSAGIDVFADGDFLGHAYPQKYSDTPAEIEGSFVLDGKYHDITVFFPRNEVVYDVMVGIDDGADVREATPYTYPDPILFYGSSITEGGCCSKPSNAHTALISRWLDCDYYNMGFSGSARGEQDICDYINSIEKSVLIMEYDHNSPSVEHLLSTHEAFFKRIREIEPDLPVVFVSRPNTDSDPLDAKRRFEVIEKTYDNAINAGDENVYLIDGRTLFEGEDREACTADKTHPNDLGMFRMAKVMAPIIKEILDK